MRATHTAAAPLDCISTTLIIGEVAKALDDQQLFARYVVLVAGLQALDPRLLRVQRDDTEIFVAVPTITVSGRWRS